MATIEELGENTKDFCEGFIENYSNVTTSVITNITTNATETALDFCQEFLDSFANRDDSNNVTILNVCSKEQQTLIYTATSLMVLFGITVCAGIGAAIYESFTTPKSPESQPTDEGNSNNEENIELDEVHNASGTGENTNSTNNKASSNHNTDILLLTATSSMPNFD